MAAVIKTGHSINRILNYNENKVKEGKAECLSQLKISNQDIFNKENETFPQEERLIKNQYSVNLPPLYNIKGKTRKSWINFINPFRALLVLGSPASVNHTS